MNLPLYVTIDEEGFNPSSSYQVIHISLIRNPDKNQYFVKFVVIGGSGEFKVVDSSKCRYVSEYDSLKATAKQIPLSMSSTPV